MSGGVVKKILKSNRPFSNDLIGITFCNVLILLKSSSKMFDKRIVGEAEGRQSPVFFL
jgi:hypothetical protein